MTASLLWQSIGELPPRGPGEHRYLLVNQAAWHGQPETMQGLKSFDRVALFGSSVDACVDGATPFLIRLDGQFGDTLAARPIRVLCETGCWASAISVLDSARPMTALAAALSARCEARLSDGQDMLLRYFDTRVLAVLLDVFTPEQLMHLGACATRWWYAGRSGALEPVTLSPWPAEDKFVPPWSLSQRQEDLLLEASEADAIVDLLTRQRVEPLLALPYESRHPVVAALLTQAKGWGLVGLSDQVAFCTLALVTGDEVARVAPWDELLPKVRSGALSFAAALEAAASAT